MSKEQVQIIMSETLFSCGGMYARVDVNEVVCPPIGNMTPEQALNLAEALRRAAIAAQPDLTAEEWRRRWEISMAQQWDVGMYYTLAVLALKAIAQVPDSKTAKEIAARALVQYQEMEARDADPTRAIQEAEKRAALAEQRVRDLEESLRREKAVTS
jgi:hypothetical protein